MNRRQHKKRQAVSLFPFLSILACVIGVFTMLVTAIAMGDSNDPAVRDLRLAIHDKTQRGRIFEQLSDKNESADAQVDATRRRIAEATIIKQELEAAREELARLDRALLTKVADAAPDAIELLARRNAIRDQIATHRHDLFNYLERIERAKQQLALRRSTPAQPEIVILGGGSDEFNRSASVPTFIECREGSVVVYENAEETARVRRVMLAGDTTFGEIVRATRATDHGIAVFLVRERGVRTYFVARSVARTLGCRYGKIPVEGDGRLDLSAFESVVRDNVNKE